MPIPLLAPDDVTTPFPDVGRALEEPNGLLMAGGALAPERLLRAYRGGIFPWYSEGEPVLWWSPDPRCVLRPEKLRVTRSLRRSLRNRGFEIRRDTAFEAVVTACAEPRRDAAGTWIVPEMASAYLRLFELGYAHSIECWLDGGLAGGLYGVRLGRMFFGESMFSRVADASKVALADLCHNSGVALIDCQITSAHLLRLGAEEISRAHFLQLLEDYLSEPCTWSS